MSGRKRGPYFKYLRSEASPQKVPRQTLANRSKSSQINDRPSVFDLISSLRNPLFENSQSSTVNSIVDTGNENERRCSIDEQDKEMSVDVDVNTENDGQNLNQDFCDYEDVEEDEQPNIDDADLRKLHSNTNCTVIDTLCMIYAFAIRHNLTWEAIEDLMRLSNEIIGSEVLKPSKYNFKKKMTKIRKYTSVKHFFCHKCDLYFGTIEDINRLDERVCPNCRVEIQTDTKYKKNHFVVMPIKSQVRDVLERNSGNLNFNFDIPATDICDVHDSLQFQHLRAKLGSTPVVTITFSTDGAACHKSTKEKSIWPLQLILNEIDLKHRFKRENMLCSAISYGKTPNMQVFFKPFIEEINKINAEGGISFKLKNGRTQIVKLYPMIFTGDIPARADVLMKSQFNGYKGCTHCLHCGSLVNNQIRYCKRDDGPLRTNEGVREDMLQAQIGNNKVNGYKGLSPLIAFDHFDVVWQVGIDKMHNIDLGVISLMFKLFLKSERNNKGYYIGHHIDKIDRRMRSIQLPKSIRRNLRPFSERQYFKAHEWKYILLFVAYPLLKDCLPERYLNHLAKLIDAVHILCSSKITVDQLQTAKEHLNSFVDEFETHYGESNMVFNVHLLRHLADCVKFIGPLPCYSNYHFEDHIGHLVSLHKGTTDTSTQICEKYLLEKNLFYYLSKSPNARKFHEEIDSKHLFSICRKVSGSLMIGNGNKILTEEEKSCVTAAFNIPDDTQINKYDEMLLNSNVFYESESHSLQKRSNDSFIYNAQIKRFATIECIVVIDENVYIVANEKFEQIFDGTNTCQFSIPLKELDLSRRKIWKAESIGPKFSLIKFDDVIACSKFPNMYERN